MWLKPLSLGICLSFLLATTSTPAEYLEPLPNRPLPISPYRLMLAIPGTSIDPRQIDLLPKIYSALVAIKGPTVRPPGIAIRHEGTSVDLVAGVSEPLELNYDLHWVLATLANRRELLYDLEADDDGLFWHITPLLQNIETK